ncbi:VacJ family lipoprotein [Zoogloea sp.]|uniref:MlaA family lipoprotein n=1 Tax=Zoogloea sp. TaxID=49181 RepID=UPI002607EB5F|nr:VacJ family lipoprotein [Zoogloea sp.]MDD3354286.1 VacJ family lipoprotein [Zoogloea sp.]
MTSRSLAALALALGLSACASTGGHPKDPLEPLNRATFAFNEKADQYVMRPVAEAYDRVAPLPVKVGVGNFFGNIGDVWTGFNNLLQGKLSEGLSDAGRVLVNTTVGMLGLFDIATELGLEKHEEDLGQTLGWWGVGDGPYLVLPFLGASNLRDTLGLVGDLTVDPVWQVEEVATRNSLTGLRFVHKRHTLLGAETAAEQAALDKYAYLRSFYIQYRLNQIHDGNPPRLKDPEDEEDEEAHIEGPASPLAGAPAEPLIAVSSAPNPENQE